MLGPLDYTGHRCHTPGGGDRRQRGRRILSQPIDQPRHRRIRRHRPEHLRRGAQLADVGQTVPTDRQRDGQVQQYLARSMPRQRPLPRPSASVRAEARPTVSAVRSSSTAPAFGSTLTRPSTLRTG
jgi:hypothetical protein